MPSSMALPKAVANYFDFLRRYNLAESTTSLAVYQVHEDLRLVRGWSNLRVIRADWTFILGIAPVEFDSVFPGVSDPCINRTQAVVPLTTRGQLTPRIMHDMCSVVRDPVTKEEFRCVTVAIVDQDSTTAYYRVFNKFEEIVHMQWKQKKTEDGAGEGGESSKLDDDYMSHGGSSDSDSMGSASGSDS